MPEMLAIGAGAVLVALLVLLVVLLWRPARNDDTDRFSKARRITTGWAAAAGTGPTGPGSGASRPVDPASGAPEDGPPENTSRR